MNEPRPSKRGVVTVVGTVAGVAAVLLLGPNEASLTEAIVSTPSSGDAESSAASPSASASSSATSSSTSSSGTADSSTSASTDTSSGVSGQWDGAVYDGEYGAIQVQVTIEDGQITDIAWLQLPSSGNSSRINATAAPTLIQEALAAQSADVDTVSGASYTSEGFRTSLQAALDEAGL